MAEGISLLRKGLTNYHAAGAELWVPHFMAYLAAAYEIAKEVGEATRSLDDGLQIVARTGERWFAAELNRHKGQLLQRQGHTEATQELYRKALSIAEEQTAELWGIARRREPRPAQARPGPLHRGPRPPCAGL